MIKFAWNSAKARANLKKHGVSFEEAQSVFYDENAIQFFDPESSSEEDRFLMLGLSDESRIRLVCHCERSDDVIVLFLPGRPNLVNESTTQAAENEI